MPDTAYRANQTQHSTANQTQHLVNSKPNTEQQRETKRNRGFYLEKKKEIANTQIKTKPQQTHGHVAATPQLALRRRRRSPFIADRRSASAPVLGQRSVDASSRSVIGDLPLTRCFSAPAPAVRPSLNSSRFFNLSLSLSLSH